MRELDGLRDLPADPERLLLRNAPGPDPIGAVALVWAFSPPELITEFYTAGVGVLSASLFVPTVAGLWWKKANLAGGVGSVVSGAAVYVLVQVGVLDVGLAPVVVVEA